MIAGSFKIIRKPAGIDVSGLTSSLVCHIKLIKPLSCSVEKLHYWYLQSDSIEDEDLIDHKRRIIMPPGYMEAPADVNYENEGQWRRHPAKPVTQLADSDVRRPSSAQAFRKCAAGA
ncbi:hypothetical protein ABR39_00890 [Enterobacter genomosp. O]|nr:hypothetical protein ABR39_00890 [Enterobacter genomosp. O]